MRLSRQKINHLSHIIIETLDREEDIKFLKERNLVRLDIVRVITRELQLEDKIDEVVRKRLSSYSRKIIEGSQEWDVLYQKFYSEEMEKIGK